LFSTSSFDEAFKESYIETCGIKIPLVIFLMRTFSAVVCSAIVTGISNYLIGHILLHESYFNILTLIIFTVEFMKAYICSQNLAYGPLIAKICVYKNIKLGFDIRRNIYVQSKYIKNE